jgi:hypothetical protein
MRIFERIEDRWLFWTALFVGLAITIWPVWIGPIFPAWDWGGHLAMADVWARLEDVELYREIYERRGGLMPNTVAARFVGWLYPVVDPLAALRLFTTLLMVATVGSLWAVTRVFGRSHWLVLLCIPFLWNGSFYYGMINYVAVFPLLFGMVALSARTAEDPDWTGITAMAALGVASFFVHGLGCLFTVAAGAIIYALSVHTPRRLLGLIAFLPTLTIWYVWQKGAAGSGLPSSGFIETLRNAAWFGLGWTLDRAYKHSLDVTTLSWESWVLTALGLAWTVSIVGSFLTDQKAPRDRGFLYRHRLHLLAAFFLVCLFCTPGYIRHTNINTRFVPLLIWTLALVPRVPEEHLTSRLAGALAFVTTCAFGAYLAHSVDRLDRQELTPMVEVIDQVPPQSRVDCLQVGGERHPVFHGRPLQHNCPGLVHSRRSSYGEFGFPNIAFSPVAFRTPGFHVRNSTHAWHNLGGLQSFDYLIIRGDHRAPPETVAVRVAEAGGQPAPDLEPNRTHTSRWSLYRVLDQAFDATHRDLAGGSGGHPFQWSCDQSSWLDGFSAWIVSDSTVSSLRPICERRAGDAIRGPQIGAPHGNRHRETARCPADSVAVGLAGRAGQFVDQLDLLCAPIHSGTDANGRRWRESEIETIEGGGGTGGNAFRITCPPDSAAAALVGRNGARLDAVGVACRRLESPR